MLVQHVRQGRQGLPAYLPVWQTGAQLKRHACAWAACLCSIRAWAAKGYQPIYLSGRQVRSPCSVLVQHVCLVSQALTAHLPLWQTGVQLMQHACPVSVPEQPRATSPSTSLADSCAAHAGCLCSMRARCDVAQATRARVCGTHGTAYLLECPCTLNICVRCTMKCRARTST